jgi:hypothetical protein
MAPLPPTPQRDGHDIGWLFFVLVGMAAVVMIVSVV